MPAGTLTLTNNSAAVKGTGTAFNTELKPGDMIVSVVGGVTYTLPVKTVDSATQATLIKAYDGPTQSGAAWYAVPRDAMNTITAQLAAETAKALRGLNLDKNNWQQVFSGTGNITVTLPDGSTYTGPAWNSITSALNLKADKTEVDKKADKSSLGTAASANLVKSNEEAHFGTIPFIGSTIKLPAGGAGVYWASWQTPNLGSVNDGATAPPFRVSNGGNQYASASILFIRDGEYATCFGLDTDNQLAFGGWSDAGRRYIILSEKNTTIDGNGFIKKASPIVKLFGDGSCELNEQSAGVTTERVSDGVYRVSGTLGFNADAEWGGSDGGIEVPLDRNKQPLIWVDYEVEPTGDLLIKTYHRTHPTAPAFARNEVMGYDEGMPIDIPEGRWVDLRVEMPMREVVEDPLPVEPAQPPEEFDHPVAPAGEE